MSERPDEQANTATARRRALCSMGSLRRIRQTLPPDLGSRFDLSTVLRRALNSSTKLQHLCFAIADPYSEATKGLPSDSAKAVSLGILALRVDYICRGPSDVLRSATPSRRKPKHASYCCISYAKAFPGRERAAPGAAVDAF